MGEHSEGHVDEHGHVEGDFLHEVVNILTDPAHLFAEVVFSVLDVLMFGLLVPFVWSIARRKSRREFEALLEARVLAEHRAIDAEHGIEPHIEVEPQPDATGTASFDQVSRA